MKIKTKQILVSSLMATALLGCSAEDAVEIKELPDSVPNDVSIGQVSGGDTQSPVRLSRGENHIISINPSQNFYTVDMDAGDIFYLNVDMDYLISPFSVDDCYRGSSPTQGITIVSEDTYHYSCGNDLVYQSRFGGTYTIQVAYPGNSGSFVYAIDGDETSDRLQPENGNGGSADKPREVIPNKEYPIFHRSFFNYFWYEGTAGETIEINQFLFNSYSPRAEIDCINESQPYGQENFNQYGISINNGAHNCGDTIRYTFSRDTVALIHFKTIEQTNGFFTLSSDK